MRFAFLLVFLCFLSCTARQKLLISEPFSDRITGTSFYKTAASYGWKQRDSFAMNEILRGNIPAFLKRFVPVSSSFTDSSGRKYEAIFYVTADYLSVGNDDDWARVPLTPMAAQRIADSLQCFLPTRKIVDLVYAAATVRLEPVPLFAFRDSTPTMYHHHLIIEGQRKGRKGLIAGTKKDVVVSSKVRRDPKPNRVAIYGWHRPDGRPIQPLYTGHVNWYVDYSHGIRLVQHQLKVDGKWMHYRDVLQHPVLRRLLCDEDDCNFSRYPF